MPDPDHDIAIIDRLAALEAANHRLERQGRSWRSAALGLLSVMSLAMLAGAARSRSTLEAGEFVLRDDQGRMRAALAIRPDGTPGLGLFDDNGQVRLSCELGPQGAPGIQLHDAIGTLRATVAIRPDETPGLGLFAPDGRVRASVDLGPDGSSGINVYDHFGALRAAMAIRPDGTPGLGVFDERGEVAPITGEAFPRRMNEPAIR